MSENSQAQPAPFDANALLETLATEARRRHRWMRFYRVFVWLWLAGFLAGCVYMVWCYLSGTKMVSDASFILHSVNLVSLLVSRLCWSERQKNAFSRLAELQDTRAVAPLIDALSTPSFHVGVIEYVREVRGALSSLLLHMQASDAPHLNSQQRATLNKELKGKNKDLALAVLKAWEQVGDGEALPFVERLAQGEGLAKKHPDVQKAARQCLPFLTARADQERQSRTLLRASAPQTSPDVLLRPASATQETPSEILLRATE